jgi:hypothetical protein
VRDSRTVHTRVSASTDTTFVEKLAAVDCASTVDALVVAITDATLVINQLGCHGEGHGAITTDTFVIAVTDTALVVLLWVCRINCASAIHARLAIATAHIAGIPNQPAKWYPGTVETGVRSATLPTLVQLLITVRDIVAANASVLPATLVTTVQSQVAVQDSIASDASILATTDATLIFLCSARGDIIAI